SKSDDYLNITNGFNFLADINFTNDTGFYSGIGAEYLRNIKGMETALRFGYNTNVKGLDRLGGFSSGIGLTYKKYTLDYAIAPYGEFGLTHRISISVIF
ncbi:MAG: hypothetical protein NT145_00375, partial [Elusimicrobia bacterium]|nr:hypothetical protein [Elusimicrobiota bacterium]